MIGVAAYKDLAVGEAPAPFFFRGDSPAAIASGRLMVRVKGDAAFALPLLRGQILAVDPSVAVAGGLRLFAPNAPACVPVPGFNARRLNRDLDAEK